MGTTGENLDPFLSEQIRATRPGLALASTGPPARAAADKEIQAVEVDRDADKPPSSPKLDKRGHSPIGFGCYDRRNNIANRRRGVTV